MRFVEHEAGGQHIERLVDRSLRLHGSEEARPKAA
jgi:hypothetical protein